MKKSFKILLSCNAWNLRSSFETHTAVRSLIKLLGVWVLMTMANSPSRVHTSFVELRNRKTHTSSSLRRAVAAECICRGGLHCNEKTWKPVSSSSTHYSDDEHTLHASLFNLCSSIICVFNSRLREDGRACQYCLLRGWCLVCITLTRALKTWTW